MPLAFDADLAGLEAAGHEHADVVCEQRTDRLLLDRRQKDRASLDGRTDTSCTDYGQWAQAWTEIKG